MFTNNSFFDIFFDFFDEYFESETDLKNVLEHRIEILAPFYK
jgi:hypothetical protein